MRNLLVGLILGVSLTVGFAAGAGPTDPKIVGESGRQYYAIAVNGEVECEDTWANVPDKVIECDYEAPEAPPRPSRVVETG